jgi:hypothetical protein
MTTKRLFIKAEEAIEQFLLNYKPTETSSNEARWIQMFNPNVSPPGIQVKTIKYPVLKSPPKTIPTFTNRGLSEFISSQNLKHQTKKAAAFGLRSKILQAAIENNSTTGKWIIRTPFEKVNQEWKKIGTKTYSGQLGTSAKVATNNGEEVFVICVYNDDFTNLEEIQRIHKVLKEMGCEPKSYKPDCLTELGLNSGNPYGIDVVLYRIGTKNDTDFVKLKEIGGIIEEDRIKGEVFKKRKGEMKDGPKKK